MSQDGTLPDNPLDLTKLYFCPRCDRAYDLDWGEQIENWAWKKNERGEFYRNTNKPVA